MATQLTSHGASRAMCAHQCRMSDYSLLELKQVYACTSACDEVTEAAIEAQIATRAFPHGVPQRDRQFERGLWLVMRPPIKLTLRM